MSLQEEIKEEIKGSAGEENANWFLNDCFVDVFDKRKWLVAQIIERNPPYITVHYEAWSDRFNERVPLGDSSKLAPFRLHSVGYTGQKNQPFRPLKDRNTLLVMQELEQKQQLVLRLIKAEFNGAALSMTPFDVVQQIRGSLFFYADSLLSLSWYYKLNKENLPQIFDFFSLLYELIAKWLKHFPSIKASYSRSRKDAHLYLRDFDVAMAMCYPELGQMLGLTFLSSKARMAKSFEVSF